MLLIEASGDEQRMAQAAKRYPRTKSLLPAMLPADPTDDKRYLMWLAKLTDGGDRRWPEDVDGTRQALAKFEELRRKRVVRGPEADIMRYTTFGDLVTGLEKLAGAQSKGERQQAAEEHGAKLVLDAGPWQVYKLTTAEAASKTCRHTNWCVKDPRMAKGYLGKGPLYAFFKHTEPVALLHEPSGQFKDPKDKAITDAELVKEIEPLRKRLGLQDTHSELRVFTPGGWPTESQLQSMPEAVAFDHPGIEVGIAWLDKHPDVLKDAKSPAWKFIAGRLERELTPEAFVQWLTWRAWRTKQKLKELGYRPHPSTLERIRQSPEAAGEYAVSYLEDAWPQAEDAIAKSPRASWYAMYIAKRRLPQAEEHIAKGPSAADYALQILKRRWPEAEGRIARSPMAYQYADIHLPNRRFEDELHHRRAILSDRQYAQRHARNSMKLGAEHVWITHKPVEAKDEQRPWTVIDVTIEGRRGQEYDIRTKVYPPRFGVIAEYSRNPLDDYVREAMIEELGDDFDRYDFGRDIEHAVGQIEDRGMYVGTTDGEYLQFDETERMLTSEQLARLKAYFPGLKGYWNEDDDRHHPRPWPATAKQLYESTDERDDEDAAYWSADAEQEAIEDVVRAFRSDPKGRQHWTVVPFAKVQRIWQQYADKGYVRDERGMREIADTIMHNVFKLNANTVIMGHTPHNVNRDYLDDSTTDPLTEEELDDLFPDWCIDPVSGHWRISDYQMDRLMNDAMDLYKAKTAEERLQIVDRIFNRAHQRGDLSSWFIEGGSGSLDSLANESYGG